MTEGALLSHWVSVLSQKFRPDDPGPLRVLHGAPHGSRSAGLVVLTGTVHAGRWEDSRKTGWRFLKVQKWNHRETQRSQLWAFVHRRQKQRLRDFRTPRLSQRYS